MAKTGIMLVYSKHFLVWRLGLEFEKYILGAPKIILDYYAFTK